MARGDKNKRGISRGGNINQSNQPFTGTKHKKSDHNGRYTGGGPSEPQEPRTSFDDGNRSPEPEHEARSLRTEERRFNLIVDNVPYVVKAAPFLFNGETRYKVSFNESSEHVFTWDSSMGQ